MKRMLCFLLLVPLLMFMSGIASAEPRDGPGALALYGTIKAEEGTDAQVIIGTQSPHLAGNAYGCTDANQENDELAQTSKIDATANEDLASTSKSTDVAANKEIAATSLSKGSVAATQYSELAIFDVSGRALPANDQDASFANSHEDAYIDEYGATGVLATRTDQIEATARSAPSALQRSDSSGWYFDAMAMVVLKQGNERGTAV